VTAYLVESAGFPAQKISARGVNGADPVTHPDRLPAARSPCGDRSDRPALSRSKASRANKMKKAAKACLAAFLGV
jgi:hypothetical protein